MLSNVVVIMAVYYNIRSTFVSGYIKELVAYIIVLINWSLLCLFNPIESSEFSSECSFHIA